MFLDSLLLKQNVVTLNQTRVQNSGQGQKIPPSGVKTKKDYPKMDETVHLQ